MSFHQFEVVPTRRSFENTFRRGVVACSVEQSSDSWPDGFGVMAEYKLTGALSVTFRANNVQYDGALQIAARSLIGGFYAKQHLLLSQLQLAISDGDQEAAIALCGEMRDSMTWDAFQVKGR